MKKNVAIATTLISSLFFAGSALARGVQSDSEGDMLYGQGAVAVSPSQVFVYTGPVQNGSETDLLYNRGEQFDSALSESPDRLADDRDISTDLIYGS